MKKIRNNTIKLINIGGTVETEQKSDGSIIKIYGLAFLFDNKDIVYYNVTDNRWEGENHMNYIHDYLIQCALCFFNVCFDELEDVLKATCPYEMAS